MKKEIAKIIHWLVHNYFYDEFLNQHSLHDLEEMANRQQDLLHKGWGKKNKFDIRLQHTLNPFKSTPN